MEMNEEYTAQMSNAKRIFTKVSRQMTESMHELTQERDQYED